MLDVVYIAGTIAFFGAMLAYVRACDALGHSGTELRTDSSRNDSSRNDSSRNDSSRNEAHNQ